MNATLASTRKINVNALLNLFSVSEKTRRTGKPLSAAAQKQIRKFREQGATLQVIADVLGYSIMTVFKYSASVPCSRRHNKTIRISRRTGLAA